jgi:hypothetical protein
MCAFARDRTTVREPGGSDSRRRPVGTHASLVNLQRSAGNRAVAELVARRRPLPVQRFDTGEHAQIGSGEVVHVNGVEFTRRQLTAMGDFYATYDDMVKAPPAELRKLKADIEKQTKYYKGEPGGADVDEGKAGWDGDTGGRYLKLAAQNDRHFGPGVDSHGKDHKTTWEENHRRALWEVRNAARAAPAGSSPGVPESAKLINDFGSHFLTDAFAAGHLLAKADIIHDAKASFDSLDHTTGWLYFFTNEFTDRVAHRIMSNPEARAKLDLYELQFIEYKPIDEERFSELLFQMAKREPELFYSTFVKAVHDPLNHSIEDWKGKPASPVQVHNLRGDTWSLPGDTTLEKSPKTLEIMNAALAQANANLYEVASLPLPVEDPAQPFSFDELETKIPGYLKSVWDYTPRPTEKGKAKIESVRKESVDATGIVAAQQFADIVLAHLDDVIAGLADPSRNVLKLKTELRAEEQEREMRRLTHPSHFE